MPLSTKQRHAMARASLTTPGGVFEAMVEDSDGNVFEHHIQDVEPILKANHEWRREAAEGNGGYSPSHDFKRVASIPLVLVEKWLFEEGINVFNKEHWPAVLAKLDDPEYSFLRTGPGRVSRSPVRSYPTTFRAPRSSKPQIVTARY
jgi:hypothetical protein